MKKLADADSITTAIIKGKNLSPDQEETLEKLTQVWGIMTNHPLSIAVVKIKKLFGISRASAYSWVKRAEDFYGEIYSVNVMAERLKQKIRLEKIVMDPKTPAEVKVRAEKVLAEILGTKQSGDSQKVPKQRSIFRRTQNPKALIEEVIQESYE